MFGKVVIALTLMLGASGGGGASDTQTTTWTGWFSDKGCAAPRVAAGNISPNGVACARKCLDEGATPVFISEQAKALYEVVDYPKVKDYVGYRVELTAVVDERAKTVWVRSVKRLSEVQQTCAVRRKTQTK